MDKETYTLAGLRSRFDQGEQLKYIFFWGHTHKGGDVIGKAVFSQWYPATFTVEGHEYKTAEHWMMAHKALLFDDQLMYEKILLAPTPGEVKALGRKIKNFDEEKWTAHKYAIVRDGNIHKFQQHATLRNFLVRTGDRVIVEASPLDRVWGIGLAENAPMIENPHTWKGENLLGFALMEARGYLITK